MSTSNSFALVFNEDTPKELVDALIDASIHLLSKGFKMRLQANDEDLDVYDIIQDEMALDSCMYEFYGPSIKHNGLRCTVDHTWEHQEQGWLACDDWDSMDKDQRAEVVTFSRMILGKDAIDPVNLLLTCTAEGQYEGYSQEAIYIADTNLVPVVNIGGLTDLTLDKFYETY